MTSPHSNQAWRIFELPVSSGSGGVGHDSQSMPGEIFPGAHFHLIADRQTSPRTDGDVEIWLIGGSFASDVETNLE